MNKLTPEFRDRLRVFSLDNIYWPKKAEVILDENPLSLYRFSAENIGRHQPLNYLEFGVAHGNSLREMIRLFDHPDCRFFGFDSFIGLPEDWLMHKKGAFANSGHPPDLRDERLKFIVGWFQNTVSDFFKSNAVDGSHPTLVHFDCDLYSSTLFLLTSLWHQFAEYYFIFDDFIQDDSIALNDFMSAYPTEIKFIAQTRGGGAGPNPDRVFGHIRRSPLVVAGV